MCACSTAIIRVYGECILDMAAFTLQLCAVVQFKTGMVASSRMTHSAGLRAIYMDCLGFSMAKAACCPVKRHVGYICQTIHMLNGIAFSNMAHGTIHIGRRLMCACTAAIVRVNWEHRFGMAAFALRLRAIIKIQTCMVACS